MHPPPRARLALALALAFLPEPSAQRTVLRGKGTPNGWVVHQTGAGHHHEHHGPHGAGQSSAGRGASVHGHGDDGEPELTESQARWQRSWLALGFEVRLASDRDCRADVVRLSDLLGDDVYVRTYDRLESTVERTDFWRYTVLWLHGGMYADLDVVARPQLPALLDDFYPSGGASAAYAGFPRALVFTESVWLADVPSLRRVLDALLRFKVTDMARLPQYRQCILTAGRNARHPMYLVALDGIVARFWWDSDEWSSHRGLSRTLLLTGPGLFTDAADAYATAAPAGTVVRIPRESSEPYFHHYGTASWKARDTVLWVDAHEKPGLCALVLLALAASAVVVYRFACAGRRAPFWRLLARLQAQRQQGLA